MKNNDMNTGAMPSVSKNLNVGAENKKQINVDGAEISSQSNSMSRSGFMDLEPGTVNPLQPSNRDTYQ